MKFYLRCYPQRQELFTLDDALRADSVRSYWLRFCPTDIVGTPFKSWEAALQDNPILDAQIFPNPIKLMLLEFVVNCTTIDRYVFSKQPFQAHKARWYEKSMQDNGEMRWNLIEDRTLIPESIHQ